MHPTLYAENIFTENQSKNKKLSKQQKSKQPKNKKVGQPSKEVKTKDIYISIILHKYVFSRIQLQKFSNQRYPPPTSQTYVLILRLTTNKIPTSGNQ